MVDAEDLPLIPDSEPGPSADEDIAAAEASLFGATDPSADAEIVDPLGRTPLFDFVAGRFVYAGGSPVYVTGLEALAQRITMALYTERFVHSIYTSRFGMEDREGPIGEAANLEDAMSDWQEHMIEAIEAIDGVATVEDVEVQFDAETKAVILQSATAVLDDESATFLTIGPMTVPLTS